MLYFEPTEHRYTDSMLSLALTLSVSLLALTSGLQKTFDGYELISFEVKTAHDAHFLSRLGDQFTDLDFWTDPVPGGVNNVLVPPALLSKVKSKAAETDIKYHVINKDIQTLVEAGSKTSNKRSLSNDIIDHTKYHSYDEIIGYLYDVQTAYPDNVLITSLPWFTHEGRNVSVVGISSGGHQKPAVVVEAGIHAREWISPAANLYFLERLLKDYHSGDPIAEQMLDTYDWYIVPVTNPDGYEYSRNADRMWRKNRRYISRHCSGVDLNRNFDSHFGTIGASSDCQSNTYPGKESFSEPETANIRELVKSLSQKNRLNAYLSIHSYSQFLLVPWGNVEQVYRPDNAEELDRVGKLMVDALYIPHSKSYLYGTSWELLQYAVSGASKDWALLKYPGIYSYCFELRPDQWDDRGFVLPAEEIIAQGEEYFNSLAVLAREMQ